MKYKSLIQFATILAVVVSLILVVAKTIAWQLTDSLSLQASLIDSLLDCVASCMNFFVVRHALKPADEDHKFGHGKAESLGALGQSAFIAGSAVWLLFEVSHRLVHQGLIEHSFVGNVVMGFATILTLLLVCYQKYVVKKTRSVAIKTDSLHYTGDFLLNIAVIFSLNVSSYWNIPWLDPLMGGIIAIYILYSAWGISRSALDVLMDKELQPAAIKKIIDLVLSFKEVVGFHHLKTRTSGHNDYIQMHVDLPQTLTFLEAHEISESIEKKIQEHFPHAEVIIHQDPVPVQEE